MRKLVVCLALAVAGCGKGAKGGNGAKPAPEEPESVYRRLVDAYIAADGKAQWAMLSAKQRKESGEALADIKSSADKLAEIAKQLDSTPEAVRAAGPEEFTSLVMKARLKHPGDLERYRSYGTPKVAKDGKRLRAWATAAGGKSMFTWTIWLVEEEGQWKVDEENEEETEIQDVGGSK